MSKQHPDRQTVNCNDKVALWLPPALSKIKIDEGQAYTIYIIYNVDIVQYAYKYTVT